ncbi:MAG TPA: hypothetical protein IGS53_08930 [Leptolyngbyaceae cyanobacterium M33_DOE_097]|uniref:Uncharacterized protein n=1 Tax=Oscillatoriales cyanobacterium SpSt-418 TaxID=2282169 RepID=A0A7C3KFN4_9CYAN|nr:hypothetical protein [Leptolyngbyaceae cyanobacterium M33_DOE_097]
MEPFTSENLVTHLDPEVAQSLLESLPQHIREAYERRAAKIEYPVWAVLEIALASFLDPDALSFLDCKPME